MYYSFRYTSFLTNGDLAPETSKKVEDAALPQPMYLPAPPAPSDVDADLAKRRVLLKYRNWRVPMATYLFFLGVGTYVTYRRDLEYPCGRTVQIELLVFPRLVKPKHAVSALTSMHDSMMWMCLSLGPESEQHHKERAELYALIKEREDIKAKLSQIVFVSGTRICDLEAGSTPFTSTHVSSSSSSSASSSSSSSSSEGKDSGLLLPPTEIAEITPDGMGLPKVHTLIVLF